MCSIRNAMIFRQNAAVLASSLLSVKVFLTIKLIWQIIFMFIAENNTDVVFIYIRFCKKEVNFAFKRTTATYA